MARFGHIPSETKIQQERYISGEWHNFHFPENEYRDNGIRKRDYFINCREHETQTWSNCFFGYYVASDD